jgi:nucleoside triphosphate diphosphatase
MMSSSSRPTPQSLPEDPLARLRAVMHWLRHRQLGCPWDIVQTFQTIAPYTIEEAYEVADAIERDDMDALKEELGDLLFQVVYHAEMARERAAFDFDDVASAIGQKMIDRHPHVFGDARIADAEAQTSSWEARKAAERARKSNQAETSALEGVARALPALLRAEKLQKRAARVGFDWNELAPVIAKIEEELSELKREVGADSTDQARIQDELGDVLFAVVNLARHCKIDPEAALRGTNDKFERRFRYIEQQLSAEGRTPSDASLETMEALWQEAKSSE